MAKKTVVRKAANKRKKVSPKKSQEIPATKGHIDELRAELKADFTSLELKMEARFKKIDSRFESNDSNFKSIDSRFNSIDARFKSIDSNFKSVDSRFDTFGSKFKSIDSRFDSMDAKFLDLGSKIDKLTAIVHRSNSLIEAQEDRNRYVLDGYTQLFHRQDALEEKVERELSHIKDLIKKK